MGKHKAKSKFKVGDTIPVTVDSEHIFESDPCNKENCMFSRAALAWLIATYGDQDFKVRSTNHGIIFELNGREYVAVFDHKTAFKIYNYDRVFKASHSKEKARQSVRPFKARMMIEATRTPIKWPAMTEEAKEKLKLLPRKKNKSDYKPKKSGVRRELSL